MNQQNQQSQPERVKVNRTGSDRVTREQLEVMARMEEAAFEESWAVGTLLWAEIRRSSKYAGQADEGEKFPVFIGPDGPRGQYVVKGGPGGQYRLADVLLYAQLTDDTQQLIQLTKLSSDIQI